MMFLSIAFIFEAWLCGKDWVFFAFTSLAVLLALIGYSAIKGWAYRFWDSIVGFTFPAITDPTDYFYSSRYYGLFLNFPLSFLSLVAGFLLATLPSECALPDESIEKSISRMIAYGASTMVMLVQISEMIAMMQRSANAMGKTEVNLPPRLRYAIYGHPMMFYGMGLMVVGIFLLLLEWITHLFGTFGYLLSFAVLTLGGLLTGAGLRRSGDKDL